MDIPAYACSLTDYIARNTISPFALVFHLLVIGGWLISASTLAALGIVLYRATRRRAGVK